MVLDRRSVRVLGLEKEDAARTTLDGARVHRIVLIDILSILLVEILLVVLVVLVVLVFVVLAASAPATHSS